MGEAILAVGTRKGLFLARSGDGRRTWRIDDGPYFPMTAVYSVGIDTRRERPRLLVGATSEHWGPAVFRSDDTGRTWQEDERGAVRFPSWCDAAVARVWQLQPAGPDEPDVVYAGVEPGALFRSVDGGETFTLVEGLWNHPARAAWTPGFGGLCLHTVLPDPTDPASLLVAVSTGGVFRTSDGGASWAPANTGIEAPFLPDPYPEFGQCVHKVVRDAVDPRRLLLQNHGRPDASGVYRSEDGGATWTPAADGLPNQFGFAAVAHPRREGTAYVFPLVADMMRMPAERRCRVYRTEDAGKSWQPLGRGLPEQDHYGVVLRDAMCADDGEPAGVYFGNRNGEVYASADEGDSWTLVAAHLPDVLCVRAVVLE